MLLPSTAWRIGPGWSVFFLKTLKGLGKPQQKVPSESVSGAIVSELDSERLFALVK